jgi:hypothetical protein
MRGSASGPLGALLLIAPLAAIPVFAIMGVPQFTSVVASPGDEDEFSDLGDSTGTLGSTGALDSGRSETPARSRTDDLFVPLSDLQGPIDTARSPRGIGRPPAGSSAISGREPQSKSTLPPSEALDNWEVRPGITDAFPGKTAEEFPGRKNPSRGKSDDTSDTLEIPVDGLEEGQVSPVGFSPELLKPSSNRPRANSRAAEGSGTRPSAVARPDLKKNKPANDAGPSRLEAFPESMSEQSGWQAAARRLKELGIRKYNLDSQIEEQTFTFHCSFASPDNPRIVTRFEADADNPLEAVQKVLAEIDDWRNRDEMAAAPREE